MNLSQDNEDRKENYMDVDEGAKQPQQQGQQANPNAMEIEPNNNSEALPKLEGVKQQQTSSQGPPAEQFNSIENSAEDTVAAKNLVNESDDDDFDAQMEKLKRVNNDTLRCEYPGCEKIFIGKSPVMIIIKRNTCVIWAEQTHKNYSDLDVDLTVYYKILKYPHTHTRALKWHAYTNTSY